ncbi:anthrone oxygenase family protein [Labrys neptuniae]
MLERTLYVTTFMAAVGSGLVAGIFFAFSNFVMPALGRVAPASGIAAMQAINVTVINPGFMLAFMGTAVLCLGLALGSWFWLGEWSGKLLLAASLVYLVGCVGVTMALNVPLNDALAAALPETAQASELWQRFLVDWTFWNSVRTAASTVAMMLFTLVLISRSAS